MGFTEEEKALIRQTAWEVAGAMETREKERVQRELALHSAQCPVGMTVRSWSGGKAAVLGLFVLACSLAGLLAAIAKIAEWIGNRHL